MNKHVFRFYLLWMLVWILDAAISMIMALLISSVLLFVYSLIAPPFAFPAAYSAPHTICLMLSLLLVCRMNIGYARHWTRLGIGRRRTVYGLSTNAICTYIGVVGDGHLGLTWFVLPIPNFQLDLAKPATIMILPNLGDRKEKDKDVHVLTLNQFFPKKDKSAQNLRKGRQAPAYWSAKH